MTSAHLRRGAAPFCGHEVGLTPSTFLDHPADATLLPCSPIPRTDSHRRGAPQFSPTGQNRYLKVTFVGKGEVRLAYTLMVGEVPALRARKGADANGNGQVDPSEQQAAANVLREAVSRGLNIEVDGARRPIRWEPPIPGFSTNTQVGPIPFSIDLVGRVTTGGGEHRVHLDDGTPIEDLGETEIRLEEGPGVDLVAAWQGREDNGRQVRFLFQGPKFSLLEDRSVGFRFIDHT